MSTRFRHKRAQMALMWGRFPRGQTQPAREHALCFRAQSGAQTCSSGQSLVLPHSVAALWKGDLDLLRLESTSSRCFSPLVVVFGGQRRDYFILQSVLGARPLPDPCVTGTNPGLSPSRMIRSQHINLALSSGGVGGCGGRGGLEWAGPSKRSASSSFVQLNLGASA